MLMTPQQFVGLAVRLFAIWLALSSLQMFGVGSGVENQPGLEPSNIPYALGAVIVLVSVTLWFFPMVVAHKLIPKTKFDNALRLPGEDIVVVSCIIFALWLFVVKVLPGVAYYISLLAIMVKNQQHFSDYEQFHFLRLGPLAIYIVVATLLAMKPHKISAFLLTDREG
jgi:hypothetical protein